MLSDLRVELLIPGETQARPNGIGPPVAIFMIAAVGIRL